VGECDHWAMRRQAIAAVLTGEVIRVLATRCGTLKDAVGKPGSIFRPAAFPRICAIHARDTRVAEQEAADVCGAQVANDGVLYRSIGMSAGCESVAGSGDTDEFLTHVRSLPA
jgi:hypothetical protein